jgi:hypothetical protein
MDLSRDFHFGSPSDRRYTQGFHFGFPTQRLKYCWRRRVCSQLLGFRIAGPGRQQRPFPRVRPSLDPAQWQRLAGNALRRADMCGVPARFSDEPKGWSYRGSPRNTVPLLSKHQQIHYSAIHLASITTLSIENCANWRYVGGMTDAQLDRCRKRLEQFLVVVCHEGPYLL